MSYKHRQTGYVIIAALLGAVPIVLGIILNNDRSPVYVFYSMLAILVLMTVLFATLTVEIRDGFLRISFDPGLIKKKVPLSAIAACRSVRNPWWYGWGIHLTPRGRLYNVSGSEAVELDLRNGRHMRIGTDEPEVLCTAILEKITKQS